MILATVGTQLPFPRLLEALDRIAFRHHLRIVAQTCANIPTAKALEQHEFFTPAQFDSLVADARLIVGHAGVGTIFVGARWQKPLVLYPRRVDLGEHRNDHQMATAAAIEGRRGVYVAWSDRELEELLLKSDLETMSNSEAPSKPTLVNAISDFIRSV